MKQKPLDRSERLPALELKPCTMAGHRAGVGIFLHEEDSFSSRPGRVVSGSIDSVFCLSPLCVLQTECAKAHACALILLRRIRPGLQGTPSLPQVELEVKF